jgi:Na+/proline symporter
LSIVLIVVNFIFLLLGALLAIYALQNNISIDRSDSLFPTIALQHLSATTGIVFIVGLVAAAYSSADSALTALTTSFCVDILGVNRVKTKRSTKTIRYTVHIGFSALLFFVLLGFWWINNQSVVNALFKFAGYTYGPLLGLFAFGLFTKFAVRDNLVPFVCLLAPMLTYLINSYSEVLLWGYKFGFELLLLNGLLTFLGLWLVRKPASVISEKQPEPMEALVEMP